MRILFVLICLLISYGSLYPFQFDWTAATWHDWSLLSTLGKRSGLNDKLSNILLFVPYGLVGLVQLSALTHRRIAGLVLAGVFLAFVLQILQLYLPSRDALLQDALWNSLGLALGAAVAVVTRMIQWRHHLPKLPRLSPPMILASSWLLYRLFPWIPSVDWQEWKNSLKPLLQQGPQLIPSWHDACGWLLCFSLLESALSRRLRPIWTRIMIPSVFLLEILIIKNSLSWNNLTGGSLALLIWPCLSRQHHGLLASLLMLQLLLFGAWPFELSAYPQHFSWIPFQGFLQGAVWTNTLALLEKCFFFGGTLFLMRRAGSSAIGSCLCVTIVVGCSELGQIFLSQHRAEITDLLLVLLLSIILNETSSHSDLAPNIQAPIMRHPNALDQP